MSDDFRKTGRPQLVPSSPLRARGDAYAEAERNRQANLQRNGPPAPEPSPLERLIEQERARVKELQDNGRELLARQQAKARQEAERRFDEDHADIRREAAAERAEIEARRDAGRMRGWFNRVSGRAGQDDERLQMLDAVDREHEERREESLAPLREQQRQERAELDEAYRHESEEFERTVEAARERGHFPEHARQTRDERSRRDGRERDDGREQD